MLFSLLAAEALTESANTDVTRREPEVTETVKLAAVGADDQLSDAAASPSILVLHDLWRYVPGYFQTLDAVQPRSEAGRRLLERRRRQIERQQQQQQPQPHQQQRKGDATAPEPVDSQRGTLPVDQLLAYITNSATNRSASTSTSCKGRRRKKQSTPSSDAVVDGSSSSNHVLDVSDKSRGDDLLHEVRKKEIKPDDAITVSDVADGDTADFVVVRRGRKYKTERPTQLQTEVQLGRHRRQKATFCDLLDEFSLQDDKVVTPRAADDADDFSKSAAPDNTRFLSAATISASTKSSQTSPLSIQATQLSEVSSHCTDPDYHPRSSDCLRPVSLRYNDAVKRNRPNWTENSVVVDVPTRSSITDQHKEPCSGPDIDVSSVQPDVRLVDVPTASLDRDTSYSHTKHIIGRVVRTVSCSTQTSSAEMPRYSTPPPSSNCTAVVDVTENVNPPPQTPNPPVVFLDAKATKVDNDEVLRGGSGLYFGSFDDVTSTSLGGDNDKEATPSKSVGRCSDAATSPIKLSHLPVLSPTSDVVPVTVASHCRRITPLCRTTGSSSSATGAPVGIVPPIMHVDTASGDVSVSADENFLRKEVSRQYAAPLCRL